MKLYKYTGTISEVSFRNRTACDIKLYDMNDRDKAPTRLEVFGASDCKIAEYNIFSTLLYFTLLYFVDCFAGNTRKCCFQCISARICVQNGISAPVILFFVVFWDNCVCCLA